jgi:hypothetical protein
LAYESEWCGCGQTLQYGQVATTRCNLTCSGNSAEVCGGSRTISVYYTQISINLNKSYLLVLEIAIGLPIAIQKVRIAILKKRLRSKIFWIAIRRQIAIRIAIDCDGLLKN